jgi:hypothetical protein
MPALVVAAFFVAQRAFRRFPRLGERAAGLARAHAATLALVAPMLVLVLPFGFRELGTVDHQMHEGQHLGWINSVSFGKFMMADAGFIYGPLREYVLADIARLLGGLTLENVRLAHVATNVAGLALTFAAVRRFLARDVPLQLVFIVLSLVHTPLLVFVVYTDTISFGWGDLARTALPVFIVTTMLMEGAASSRRRLVAWGVLAGVAFLYSQEFGAAGAVACVVGLASLALSGDFGVPARARLLAAGRRVASFCGGVAIAVGVFLAWYAVNGKLVAFGRGLFYTVIVVAGAWSGTAYPLEQKTFLSWETMGKVLDNTLGTTAFDYALGPGIALVGAAFVMVRLWRGGWTPNDAAVLALTLLAGAAQRQSFLRSDPWHQAGATAAALPLLAALVARARATLIHTPRGALVPVGRAAAGALLLLWLVEGGLVPLHTRALRLAQGSERPSFGPKREYPDVPRAGDVLVPDNVLHLARFIRSTSTPDDTVFCAVHFIPGGAEAFLFQRRNPTPFDVPAEIVSFSQQRMLLEGLKREPPKYIVGAYFGNFGDEARRFIADGWEPVGGYSQQVLRRKAR